MHEPADRVLQERFDRLRVEDAAAAPSFDRTVALARRRALPPRAGRAWGLAAAALVLVVAAVTFISGRRSDVVVDLAAARWRGPTDFLLAVPGAELLRTVPSFRSGLPGGRAL